MKLLVATGVYPPESGGPATHTKLMEERLPLLGFEVRVLPFRTVRHLPKGIRHVAYFRSCLRMARGVDVVFAQDTVSVGFPAALAALLLGKKFVVRVPGDYAWEQGSQRFGAVVPIEQFQNHYFGVRIALLRAVQRFVVHRATLVIAPSAYLKELIIGWGAHPDRVALVYNGIELPVPCELPHTRPEGFLVVSVGRRVPWKGFDALERVAKAEGWQLYIAETDSRPKALGWIKAADVFVLNSSYEGLSHTLIEAMSLGVAIVATNVGGNPELIHDGVEGLLISAGDDAALRAALLQIANNKTLAQQLGDAAARRAQDFSIEKTIPALAHVLQRI